MFIDPDPWSVNSSGVSASDDNDDDDDWDEG